MRTRISKHGKYEIMEGSYGEMKDLLQPGDIFRTLDNVPEGMKRSDYDVRIVHRIPSQEIMDQVMENLPFPSKVTAIFAMVESPTEGFSHSWAIQNLRNGMMYIWFGEHDATPCLIKRRRISATDIQADNIRGGEKVKEPEWPTEPGLYADKDGDVAVFFYEGTEEYLSYVYVATREGVPWHEFGSSIVVPSRSSGCAPWRRVNSINQIEVE